MGAGCARRAHPELWNDPSRQRNECEMAFLCAVSSSGFTNEGEVYAQVVVKGLQRYHREEQDMQGK